MQVTTRAIVISSLKYSDTSLIVKALTASDGLKSYLLKGILSPKRKKLKAAHFQPLTQLELVAVHRNKGTLESIREAKVIHPYKTLHTDIVKNSVVLFLSEMLANSIYEEERDVSLYNYLEYALLWLDTHSDIANFHLSFLLNLTRYLGFYPDTDNEDSNYFDLQEGCFSTAPSLNPILEGTELEHFKKFLGINFDACSSIKMTKAARQILLQKLVLYFGLHLHGFRKPKSLAVLNAVFN